MKERMKERKKERKKEGRKERKKRSDFQILPRVTAVNQTTHTAGSKIRERHRFVCPAHSSVLDSKSAVG
ncbi:hypothetical protein K504DRAFT_458287 [Pleomassaria siparia CBS 279.74]|uniref:Uncharacterized protein n=1 Tax=Pleomassaria siparia CBS 279.74 TaxID=1314801 RepID=A0A6G1K4W8_9PLEO|nr:hypothetical protein K504DRAFT_458287 [Pleomassaria siparia CBS 279.74]